MHTVEVTEKHKEDNKYTPDTATQKKSVLKWCVVFSPCERNRSVHLIHLCLSEKIGSHHHSMACIKSHVLDLSPSSVLY